MLILLLNLITQSVMSQTNCVDVADIVFAVDQSGSILPSQFEQQKAVMQSVVSALNVDPAGQAVRVGVVLYNAVSSVEIPFFTGYSNKTDLLAKIGAISSVGGGTHIGNGLTAAHEELRKGLTGQTPGNTRTNPSVPDNQVPRIIFLMGDGAGTYNSEADAIKTGANAVVPHPVMIFSVFIGPPNTSTSNLFESIASIPASMWFVNVANFSQVNPTSITENFCTTGSMAFGDVHFTTHDGVMYTFNGAGDYIYLKTDDKIDIHVRDVYAGRATTLAALAVSDKKTGSVMEIWWDGKASERLVINGRDVDEDKNKLIELSSGKIYSFHHPFHVYQISNGVVKIKNIYYPKFTLMVYFGGRASFHVKVPKTWKTQGLGGNNNGNVKDEICNRRGNCLSLNATNAQIHQIGLDWAVLPSELLFEKWMSIQDWEIRYHELSINSEQLIAARRICGKVQPCIYDYISTGSQEYALHTKHDFEQHIRNEGKLVYVGDRF